MSSSRRLLLLGLATACLAGFAPAAARADGDPASDFLITEGVFVPYDGKFPPGRAERLTQLVHAAKAGGYPIKVALIATPYDLGAVTPLWRQPQRYARFLGQELFYIYKGRLLIVMPDGYGIYHHGKPILVERRLLDGLSSPSAAGVDVATAGSTAVRRLAGASGIKLVLSPAASSTAHGRNYGPVVIAAAAVGGAWLLISAVVLVRRHRLVREREEPSGDD